VPVVAGANAEIGGSAVHSAFAGSIWAMIWSWKSR